MIDALLEEGAAEDPSAPFLIHSAKTLSYAQARQAARRAAHWLRGQGLERVGFYAPDSPELVIGLCACAAAGCEATVLNRNLGGTEVRTLCERFELPAVIGDPGEFGTRSIAIGEAVDLEAGDDTLAPLEEREEPARLMVLTSGTTGPPKGAIYLWKSLAAQARPKREYAGTRWLLAYHLNHFAGLQMLVHALTNRASLVIPDSAAISDTIRALFEQGVEFVSGTPTFWRFLVARSQREELRRLPLRQITLGGEAVPRSIVDELRDCFPNARISQVFATTEAGSCFSVTDRENGFSASVLERSDDADVQLKIVDDQLYIRSRNGMLGYYGEELSDEPTWRPTGDLVELRDGRVHFAGRTSEVINVGGVKVNPLPIEELVSAVPGVQVAHVYGRPNPITGSVVAVDIVAEPGCDAETLEQEVRKSCEGLERHSHPRLVRIVDEIETQNRKIVRRGDAGN